MLFGIRIGEPPIREVRYRPSQISPSVPNLEKDLESGCPKF